MKAAPTQTWSQHPDTTQALRQTRRLQWINQVTRAALETDDLADTLQALADHLRGLLGADACDILLWDEARAQAVPLGSPSTEHEPAPAFRSMDLHPEEIALAGSVLQTGRAQVFVGVQPPGVQPPGVQPPPTLSQPIPASSSSRSVLGLPLVVGETRLGAALVAFNRSHHFSPGEIEDWEEVASQVSLAVAKARLLEAERQRRREAETLQDATAALVSSLDLKDVLETILSRLEKVIPYDSAAVILQASGRLKIVAGLGFADPERIVGFTFPDTNPLFRQILAQRQPLILADTQQDPRFQRWPEPDSGSIHAWMGVPLVAQGDVIGYLTLDCRQAAAYDPAQAVLAQAFANQASIAIENARLFEQTRQRAAELEALARVSSALRVARTFDEILPVLLEKTVEVTGADGGALFLLGEAAQPGESLLACAASCGWVEPRLVPARPDGSLWPLLGSAQALSTSDSNEIRALADWGLLPAESGPAAVALALLETVDAPVGLLVLTFSQPGELPPEKLRLLLAIAAMAGNALHRARLMETLEERVLVRTRELAALYDIAAVTNRYIDLQAVLDLSLEKMLAVMQSEIGMIHLLDEDGRSLRLAAQRGLSAEAASALESAPVGKRLWRAALAEGRPLMIPGITATELVVPGLLHPAAACTYLGAPIRSQGKAVGILSVFGQALQGFNVEEIALLDAIADQIGMAVESARLRQGAEAAAVMGERQRLARELHDAVTQSLYSLTLFAEACRQSLENGNSDSVRAWLKEIEGISHQSLKEMRLLLYELRPSTLEQDGLVGALRRRLEAVEGRSGVKARLLVDGDPQLPPETAKELYRIAQEALNNVLKHAAATRVTVTLAASPGRVELVVSDNGAGFDPDQPALGGMGLANMGERARRLGGSLSIQSAPGEGARIQVRMEVPSDGKDPHPDR